MIAVTTEKAMAEFLFQADNFHDALIRECALVARGFVSAERWMHGDAEPFDARVFIQTQARETPGIEIEFDEVKRFCVDSPSYLSPSASIRPGEVRFSFTTYPGQEPQVIATAMRYRFLDSTCLGEKQLVTARRSRR